MTEILTPSSGRWGTFTEALDHAVQVSGCDGSEPGTGPIKHRHAKRIMAAMGNVDVPGSIAYFEAHGGYCDCEILMNVDPSQQH
jgi:hypothetical protein